MFVSRSIGLCILLNFNVLCQERRLNSGFAYPEDEEDYGTNNQNPQHKTPVYVKDWCKSGEIFYPGDRLDDWLCDCKPAYLYHPTTDQCYPAYKQGPCGSGECLILPPNSGVPKCQPNPCTKDNFVRFRNDCHELDKPGPCMLPELWNVVGVSETSLKIICTKDYRIKLGLGIRVEGGGNDTVDIDNNTEPPIIDDRKCLAKRCYIGGRRWSQKLCPGQNETNQENDEIEPNELNELLNTVFTTPSSA